MCMKPQYFEYIQKLYQAPQKFILTQALLETLAIIAYKQPVTKIQIADLRGVNCDHVVNRLMEYGLICEVGRLEAPGRPLLFGTTEEFCVILDFGLWMNYPLEERTIEQIHEE